MRSAVVAVALLAPAAHAQDASPPPTTLAPKPSIQSAIDPAVQKWWDETREPCRQPINLGVPCFPVETQVEVPTVSVRDSLWDLGSGHRPERRPPTADEMKEARPGPQSAMGGVGFDPGCAVNRIAKALSGRNDTYYLYRVRGPGGASVVMKDAKLDPTYVQGDVEFLGKFDGECAALQAFRHEDRK